MSKLQLSKHAASRLSSRLRDLISLHEVARSVTGVAFPVGETWVKAKQLSEVVYLDDYSDNGCRVHGDVIYVIVRRRDNNDAGAVATVELRRNNQSIKGQYLVDRTGG